MSEEKLTTKKKLTPHQVHALRLLGLVVAVVVLCVLILMMRLSASHISIEKAAVSGNPVMLGTAVSGTLDEVFVHEGDLISAHTVVARVGQALIRTDVGGLVTQVNKAIGTRFNPGQAIVTVIDPHTLRVVGQLDENKGLDQVRVGQQATFTVDTFGSKQFVGIVDEISPTSRDSGIVFNISDKREVKIFNVFVRYDVDAYPELKNGMSARISILK